MRKHNLIHVPVNLDKFVDQQLDTWIDSAITAFHHYKEDTSYIVEDGVIKPVDFTSTGIVQDSTNWSDGLHQFLQLKHNLALTMESMTTNFMSNIGYFQRNKSKLFGLTGTLGSQKARKTLSELYDVDYVNETA